MGGGRHHRHWLGSCRRHLGDCLASAVRHVRAVPQRANGDRHRHRHGLARDRRRLLHRRAPLASVAARALPRGRADRRRRCAAAVGASAAARDLFPGERDPGLRPRHGGLPWRVDGVGRRAGGRQRHAPHAGHRGLSGARDHRGVGRTRLLRRPQRRRAARPPGAGHGRRRAGALRRDRPADRGLQPHGARPGRAGVPARDVRQVRERRDP